MAFFKLILLTFQHFSLKELYNLQFIFANFAENIIICTNFYGILNDFIKIITLALRQNSPTAIFRYVKYMNLLKGKKAITCYISIMKQMPISYLGNKCMNCIYKFNI